MSGYVNILVMKYVALLRGINVGGKNKVEMKRLKVLFEKLGYKNVITYINSGNVIFETNQSGNKKIEKEIEAAITQEFFLNIRVVIRSKENINQVNAKIKPTWQNNADQRTNVMFLWPEIDSPNILKDIPKTSADDTTYVSGALIWHTTGDHYKKGGLKDLAKSKLYKQMTVRNCNTVRKLVDLMN